MEALEINFKAAGATLKYRAHVQKTGWQDWVTADDKAGQTSIVGTVGASKRVEALQLSVTGLKGYSILYRAHVQGIGWQDWVDAEDPTAFAGTVGKSKRMEAFEIAIVPENEFYYVDNGDGTHTRVYNGDKKTPEECVYGEYTVNGQKFTKQCALCGHDSGETRSLQQVLTDANLIGQNKVELEKVTLDEALTIPEGVTFVVNDKFDATNKTVTVNGNLVCKYASNVSGMTIGEKGSLTYSGKYDADTDKGILNAILEAGNAKKVIFEEGSVAQDLTTSNLKVKEDTELTIELNGTTVKSSITGDAITNEGKLTIDGGKFEFGTNCNGIRTQGNESELTITDCEISGSNARAISIGENQTAGNTGIVANISDTKVNLTGTNGYAIGAFCDESTINLTNVEIVSKGAGIYTNQLFKDLKVVGNNVKVTVDNMAAYLPAEGEYTFKNSSFEGAYGIEYTRGSLDLNNTTVTAKGEIYTGSGLVKENGEWKINSAIVPNGGNGYSAAVQIKRMTNHKDEKAQLTVQGSSKLVSYYGTGIMVFGDNADAVNNVTLRYPNSSVNAFTKDANNTSVELKVVKDN